MEPCVANDEAIRSGLQRSRIPEGDPWEFRRRPATAMVQRSVTLIM